MLPYIHLVKFSMNIFGKDLACAHVRVEGCMVAQVLLASDI